MSHEELLRALRGLMVETGSLACLGCGYEQGCSTHGCAILREAVERLTELTAPPSNPPLTLEELREMDGEPVWIVEGSYSYWALITDVFSKALWITRREDKCEMLFEDYGKTWLAYRRKPEEEAAWQQ